MPKFPIPVDEKSFRFTQGLIHRRHLVKTGEDFAIKPNQNLEESLAQEDERLNINYDNDTSALQNYQVSQEVFDRNYQVNQDIRRSNRITKQNPRYFNDQQINE